MTLVIPNADNRQRSLQSFCNGHCRCIEFYLTALSEYWYFISRAVFFAPKDREEQPECVFVVGGAGERGTFPVGH